MVISDAATSTTRLNALDIPIFAFFLMAGLVPPMSEFCIATVATYSLHMLHLHPQVVVLLATFQHLCEGFVGITPSLALFRHYFCPFMETEGVIVGGVNFRLREEFEADFFDIDIKSDWGEWSDKWCFARFPSFLDCLMEPTSAADPNDTWEELDSLDRELCPAIERIQSLWDWGLTLRHIVADYTFRCISPLQERSHPAWSYAGICDKTCLWVGPESDIMQEEHHQIVEYLCGRAP